MMKMKLFGGFVLSNSYGTVSEASLHSNKMVKLLVYFLLNRIREVSRREIIDLFWQDDRSGKPEGALKTIIYRMRKALCVLGEQEWILTTPGGYRWNPREPVETDYEEMEKTVHRAAYLHGEEKRACLEHAAKIFEPGLSWGLSGENWIESRMTYFKTIFMEAAVSLAEIYEGNKNWDALEQLSVKALEVNPLDEDVYCWQVRSQIGRKNYDEAIRCYENARQIFSEQLGIRRLDKLSQAYEEILSSSNSYMEGIRKLEGTIREKEKDKGAFFCEYQIFRDICRLEICRLNRADTREYLLLITLQRSGSPEENTWNLGMKEGMKTLERILRENLRKEDVVARVGDTQFAALLIADSYPAVQKALERIDGLFQKTVLRKSLVLRFEAEELKREKESAANRSHLPAENGN